MAMLFLCSVGRQPAQVTEVTPNHSYGLAKANRQKVNRIMTEEAIIRPDPSFLSQRTAAAVGTRARVPNAAYVLPGVRLL